MLTALCSKILGKDVCNSVELQNLISNIYFIGQSMDLFLKKYFYQRERSMFTSKWLYFYLLLVTATNTDPSIFPSFLHQIYF